MSRTGTGDTEIEEARWFNPRQQAGPMCEAVYTHLQCQTLRLGNSSLRLAA